MCINSKYHNRGLHIDGLTFKTLYHPQRDVDHIACLRLLLKYGADPSKPSGPSRKLPLFKALKSSSYLFLQLLIDYDKSKSETLNTLNQKNKSLLCCLVEMEDSDDNYQKLKLLISAGARCAVTAPDHHPLYIALSHYKTRIVKYLIMNSDALKCID